MMDWTDRWCRRFHRLLTARALLYSEMITSGAIVHGDARRHLEFDARDHGEGEQPVALQLGGSDPAELARAARIAAGFGYREINLNCGCPSDRVQSGRFGACLMAEPALVGDCVAALQDAVSLPVTVKCRIGIDEADPGTMLFGFVEAVAARGCRHFIVHARKAWLQGLSPKQNREVPPLDYALVRRLKAARPDLAIVLNGGLTLATALESLAWADGAMLGRAAYQDPWCLAAVDAAAFGAPPLVRGRAELVERLVLLAEEHCAAGRPLKWLARHTLGLMNGLPGARAWRRILSEGMARDDAGPALFRQAAAAVRLEGPALAA
jgi:tRNA-dihydrouridine synthase A